MKSVPVSSLKKVPDDIKVINGTCNIIEMSEKLVTLIQKHIENNMHWLKV